MVNKALKYSGGIEFGEFIEVGFEALSRLLRLIFGMRSSDGLVGKSFGIDGRLPASHRYALSYQGANLLYVPRLIPSA
jgi:hypothetical protein